MHRWNATCTPSACATWRFREQANPAPPAANSNTGAPSATKSNGGPDPKDGSTTSNEATAGTAPNSPASTEPEPGADTASSHTTSSRSAPSQHETRSPDHTPHPTYRPPKRTTTANPPRPRLTAFQVEVISVVVGAAHEFAQLGAGA